MGRACHTPPWRSLRSGKPAQITQNASASFCKKIYNPLSPPRQNESSQRPLGIAGELLFWPSNSGSKLFFYFFV